jgi:hypothetical protein
VREINEWNPAFKPFVLDRRTRLFSGWNRAGSNSPDLVSAFHNSRFEKSPRDCNHPPAIITDAALKLTSHTASSNPYVRTKTICWRSYAGTAQQTLNGRANVDVRGQENCRTLPIDKAARVEQMPKHWGSPRFDKTSISIKKEGERAPSQDSPTQW